VAEKFEWVMDHWQQIGLVISLIALALTGKWALVKAKVAELLVQNAEGEAQKPFRKKMAAVASKAAPLVRDALNNMAAAADPDPTKKPESKARRFFKFLGRSAVKVLLKR
jgi:hypothetical protein